ncbi:hypothetical protein F4806DRAFT_317465 [Annulohypoxylon nitens]|nr:hypothetical protein F4806DRAFT_317465 [Annulohypoxylon nitens]
MAGYSRSSKLEYFHLAINVSSSQPFYLDFFLLLHTSTIVPIANPSFFGCFLFEELCSYLLYCITFSHLTIYFQPLLIFC